MRHEIVNILSASGTWMTKYEIADKICSTTGPHVTPEQVYSAIKYHQDKDNCSIYADWDSYHRQYVYNVDLEYYKQYINGICGVQMITCMRLEHLCASL